MPKPSIYHVMRWRTYEWGPQTEIVLGGNGKPIEFFSAGAAAGAVGVLNINDRDWTYYSVPVALGD